MESSNQPRVYFRYFMKAAFVLYGLYCIIFQKAYLLASPHRNFLYHFMEGAYAIAFGVSLIFIGLCFEPGFLFQWGKERNKFVWVIRLVGMATAIILGWYALLGSTGVGHYS